MIVALVCTVRYGIGEALAPAPGHTDHIKAHPGRTAKSMRNRSLRAGHSLDGVIPASVTFVTQFQRLHQALGIFPVSWTWEGGGSDASSFYPGYRLVPAHFLAASWRGECFSRYSSLYLPPSPQVDFRPRLHHSAASDRDTVDTLPPSPLICPAY